MKKFINSTIAALAILSAMVGCYNDCDTPSPAHVYNDIDFADCDIISISDLKSKYSHLVKSDSNEEITENWVIRGKVISTDKEGSIYKSLYILDHDDLDYGDGTSAAIELRLFASNYVSYPVGSMVFVRLKGLSIGDYGGVLSIGALSTVPDTEYPHTTIEGRVMLAEHIFLGYPQLMLSRDTLVVNKDNYKTVDLLNSISRLVRFEDVESCFGSADSWAYYSDTTYPSYFSSATEMFDWSEDCVTFSTPTLAYYGVDPTDDTATSSVRYYGSSWYSYDRSGTDFEYGQYVLRISAYAHFRETEIPADGSNVTITAILTRYDDTLQLNLNHAEDFVVE